MVRLLSNRFFSFQMRPHGAPPCTIIIAILLNFARLRHKKRRRPFSSVEEHRRGRERQQRRSAVCLAVVNMSEAGGSSKEPWEHPSEIEPFCSVDVFLGTPTRLRAIQLTQRLYAATEATNRLDPAFKTGPYELKV